MSNNNLLDRYLPHFTDSAKDAFVRMAGNFQHTINAALVKSWGHELEGVDPAEFEIAVSAVIRSNQVHFPRWSEFAKFLPRSKSDSDKPCWYDAYTGERGGPWPELGAKLGPKQREHLTDIRAFVLKIHAKVNGKKFDRDPEGRVAFLDYLGQLLGAEVQEALPV